MMKCTHCNTQFIPKRKEQKYCSKSCASVKKGHMRKGQKTGLQCGKKYKKRLDKDGYIRVYAATHPFANGRIMILEHVAVMEMSIGRRIQKNEVVHHINHVRTDNRLENLKLMDRKTHCQIHGMQSQLRERKMDGRFA